MLPSDAEVLSQGFKPLKKMTTMPSSNGSKTEAASGGGKRVSFCDIKTGEVEHSQGLWENSPWGKMERGMGRLERANSFVGRRDDPNTGDSSCAGKPREGLVAIVDPFSTGAHLAAQAAKLGYGVIRVFSVWDSPVAALIQEGVTVDFFATVQFNDQAPDLNEATNQCVRDLQSLPQRVIAVLPGAETGVELAESLAHRMGLRGNGENGSFARRNKYAMGEKVRESGTRAVKQRLCRSVEELESYICCELGIGPGHTSEKCVVKPVQSAGSDCVYLCSTYEEAIEAFLLINGKRNGLGLINDGALAQEFLSGTEYVIDKVSRDGVHKVVAVWEYDKRLCNGHNFVYFGNRLRPSDTERAQEMIRYADSVLDALEISQGPSHMEVMYTPTGPCLVEVGSRCQGGEGTWLPIVSECIGYSQVDVTLDVYLEGALFDKICKDNYKLLKAGRDVDLVSRHAGIVRSLPGDAAIRALSSFWNISWEVHPGDFCPVTVDCFTRPGCVQLISDCEVQADADFDKLHELEDMNLIDYAIMCPKPPLTGAVVVVDPFSTGAHLAAMVLQWGYKLILVFSCQDNSGECTRVMADGFMDGAGGTNATKPTELNTTVAVGTGSYMKPSLLIQHASFERNQVKALADTVAAVQAFGSSAPILAVLAGAETGVDLADRLSEAVGTRSNGSKTSYLRQSKHASAVAVRAQGLKVPGQCLAVCLEDVSNFWKRIANDGGNSIIVKPDNSIEGDSVTICDSLEMALAAFQKIYGQFNMLSRVNEGVLCMEHIVCGTEYIVDTVSRRGESKIVAVWECDMTAAAPTMVYGMRLRDMATSRSKVGALNEVINKVLSALGVLHGPAHSKFIVDDNNSVCFLTSRACFQAGDASWLKVAKSCVGYDVLETTLNAYLRPDQYDALDAVPSKLIKQGIDVNLLSMHYGTVNSIPGIKTIRSLPSVACLMLLTQPGSIVVKTTNRMSRAGSIQLIADAESDLERDYILLKSLQLTNMVFELM